jgi:hypothetical protein
MAGVALVGARVRARRRELGLSQADVARAAGMSGSYLNLIEHDRRRIGPAALARLAAALQVAAPVLTGEDAGARVEDLRAAAAALPEAGAEGGRAEEMAARFPGWAGLVLAQAGRIRALESTVAGLNDRLGQDPHLDAALQEVLQAAASVRSTAAILAETEDIEPVWRRRFHANLDADSARLSSGAEALVAWLDAGGQDEMPGGAPQDEVEDWLAGRGWHLEGVAAEDLAALATAPARALARALAEDAAADAAAFPVLSDDPLVVAAQAPGRGVVAAMRRIALAAGARVGLVIADGAGALVLRKPAGGFPLPRGGAGCPLWPLYAALARPGAPLAAVGELPGPVPRRFLLRAFGEWHWPAGFGGPELRRAGMLISPLVQVPAGQVPLPVGGSCRICPRAACPARREPSILA